MHPTVEGTASEGPEEEWFMSTANRPGPTAAKVTKSLYNV
jgi:hypothetical protein